MALGTEDLISALYVGTKFSHDEKPFLGLIKNHANQFICVKCAEKVNPDRVRSENE